MIHPSGKSNELIEARVVDPAARDHHMVERELEVRLFLHETERWLDTHMSGEHGREETRIRKLPDGEVYSSAHHFPPLFLLQSQLGELLPR